MQGRFRFKLVFLALVTCLILIVADYYAVQTQNFALVSLAIALTYVAGVGLLLWVRLLKK